MSRSGSVGAAVLTVVALTACGGPSVSLSSRPEDLGHARALAERVAEDGGCDGFEDYSQGEEYWTFTSQSGSTTYDIITAADAGTRDSRLRAYLDRGLPGKVGDFFAVTVAQAPGQQTTESDLQGFPGRDAA